MTAVLRETTARAHASVENTLDLLSPDLTAARLGQVVARLHAFFAATEPVVDRWAPTDPDTAVALDWPRRRRAELLATDVRGLALSPLPSPAPVFDEAGTAQALGWLYVAEGSTLGGAVISRRIGTLTDRLPVELRTFTPYREGPGPMWRTFNTVLDDWVGADAVRRAEVAAAASATFVALERWVAPLRDEVAA